MDNGLPRLKQFKRTLFLVTNKIIYKNIFNLYLQKKHL